MLGKPEAPQSNITYAVDYRDIKYPRLEYKTGSLLLVLPKGYKDKKTILEKHQKWIIRKEQTIKQALEEAKSKSLNLERTDTELRRLVKSNARRYAQQYGFTVNRVFFRKMKTKWGSYSSRNNLTANTLLKYLPKSLVEYVIFHEMAHSQARRHEETFWKTVTKEFEDYQTLEKDLLVYWFLVQTHIIPI